MTWIEWKYMVQIVCARVLRLLRMTWSSIDRLIYVLENLIVEDVQEDVLCFGLLGVEMGKLWRLLGRLSMAWSLGR